jgi:hypothetical protein
MNELLKYQSSQRKEFKQTRAKQERVKRKKSQKSAEKALENMYKNKSLANTQSGKVVAFS